MAAVGGGVARKAAPGTEKKDMFHVIHKVPAGDSPYVRAKHLQGAGVVYGRDWRSLVLAGGEGPRGVHRLVLEGDKRRRQSRQRAQGHGGGDEAAGPAGGGRRGDQVLPAPLLQAGAAESLDNVLIDLFKKCGRIEEQIELLKQKLKSICVGEAFNGRATKTARSHGKKFQVSIKQETSRILGNLGWAYMQRADYASAEAVYMKAQEIEPDANKACNLSLCLAKQHRHDEARGLLEDVLRRRLPGADEPKTLGRAEELSREMELRAPRALFLSPPADQGLEDEAAVDLEPKAWTPFRSRRLPIFEEISTYRDQMAC